MVGKRRFGRVRELPSGRWQARYKGPDGTDRPAPRTFDSKTSADRWLTLTEAEIISGDWTEERPGLRPKTIELYRYLLRRHLVPASVPGRWPRSVSPMCGAGGRISSTPGSPW